MPQTSEEKNTMVLNVPYTPTDKAMLQQISKDSGISMSHIVRLAIRSRHRMQFSNQPYCSNSNPCLCPAMHSVSVAGQQTDADRVIQQEQRTNPDRYQEEK